MSNKKVVAKKLASKQFKQAHHYTRLTKKPEDVYRIVFGQWLSFIKTGITRYIIPNRVNKACAMIPVMPHDGNSDDKYSYSVSLPLTFTRYKGSKSVRYSESYYVGKMLASGSLVIGAMLCLYSVAMIIIQSVGV